MRTPNADPRSCCLSTTAAKLRLGALVLAGLFVAVGCGRTHVSMLVTQPALINAQPYGASVSVAGFGAAQPAWGIAADQIRREVEQEILRGVGGVVRLMQHGGGLVISGRLTGQDIQGEEDSRETTCKDAVRVRQGNRTVTKTVESACTLRQIDWSASVDVEARIVAANGQIVYLRHHHAGDTGSTPETRSAPTWPDAEAIFAGLRRQIAHEVAHLVVPHRARVTATLYDCKRQAAKACTDGARLLAASRYDDSLRAYDRAIALSRDAKGISRADLAKIHWNKAIVAKYAARFDIAMTELQEAIRLDPGASGYSRELRDIEATRHRHDQLIDQGLQKN